MHCLPQYWNNVEIVVNYHTINRSAYAHVCCRFDHAMVAFLDCLQQVKLASLSIMMSFYSPTGKAEGDFRFALCPSVSPDVRQSVRSISFPDYFLKCTQILTWFLACEWIAMTYRSSLSFIRLHRFLAKLQALDLVKFRDQLVFWTSFLNACRYWPDFWHVSQSPWLTDQAWVSLRSIDFWRNYRPLT